MNPMIKPTVVSSHLLGWSVLVGVCALYLVPATIANWPAPAWLTTLASLALVAALLLASRWAVKVRRAKRWTVNAQRMWQAFEEAKVTGTTTTEVTVLSVQEVQPTGAWVTIRWDRFGYQQPAWIEGAGGTYWPGSVLLITPDPTQVHVGEPWPPTYRIAQGDCRAVAPMRH
ncbi:hypothetical protein [Arthrobacter sp. SDTb3-6]|uniref:hypothetical protein n=1 Tax=Arthrobacter sp. SDTb3-6 TaxID=2713571 RepID=UPI00159D3669|nr:hypothetical protein [Arthrobacter sp. SDTb3-6]NVM97727.1 hypothetical protein [Arthrobacter sp. SDTb3-6]